MRPLNTGMTVSIYKFTEHLYKLNNTTRICLVYKKGSR